MRDGLCGRAGPGRASERGQKGRGATQEGCAPGPRPACRQCLPLSNEGSFKTPNRTIIQAAKSTSNQFDSLFVALFSHSHRQNTNLRLSYNVIPKVLQSPRLVAYDLPTLQHYRGEQFFAHWRGVEALWQEAVLPNQLSCRGYL